MSRLAKKPILIPEKVTVNLKDNNLEVKGPLGTINQKIDPAIRIEISKEQIEVKRVNDTIKSRALHGLFAALVKNAIRGVVSGFTKELEIHGVGFKADVEGSKVNISVGFTHPVKLDFPDGIKVTVDPKQTSITVHGIDKYKVGQFASVIRDIKPPEPYKGTGIRYKGERIIKKAGKAAVGATGIGTGAK